MAAYDEKNRSAKMPPLSCSVCGSVLVSLDDVPLVRSSIPLAGPVTHLSLRHGSSFPDFPGSRESHAHYEQVEIDRLYAALANVRSRCLAITDAAVRAEAAVGATAALTSRIARLERSCELLRQRLLPASTAVTRSKPPRRTAATNGLDKIALQLQRAGNQHVIDLIEMVSRVKPGRYVASNSHEPEAYLDSIIYLPHGGRIDGSQALHEPQAVHGTNLVQDHGGRFVKAGLSAGLEGNFPGMRRLAELGTDGGHDRYRAVLV